MKYMNASRVPASSVEIIPTSFFFIQSSWLRDFETLEILITHPLYHTQYHFYRGITVKYHLTLKKSRGYKIDVSFYLILYCLHMTITVIIENSYTFCCHFVIGIKTWTLLIILSSRNFKLDRYLKIHLKNSPLGPLAI